MTSAPERIGPYRIRSVLGRGGMGAVYEGEAGSGERVAVKTVTVPDADLLMSLRREVTTLSRLRHPGIVRIIEHGVQEGLPWYAMELMEGPTLGAHVQGRRKEWEGRAPTMVLSSSSGYWTERLETEGWEPQARDLEHRLTLVRRLCGALSYLHGEGLVHRDLKPDNIIVTGGEQPVIVDFGLSVRFSDQVARDELTPGGESVGTVAYLAPEQGRGELVDARADIYALGVILYELLTGHPPFVADSPWKVLQMRYEEDPLPPSTQVEDIPAGLDDIVMRMLAREPRDRYGYASDVAAALTPFGARNGAGAGRPYLYRSGFAGRDSVVASIRTRLSNLDAFGGMTLIGGESGIGKTRVATAVAGEVAGWSIRVLVGACRADPEMGRDARPPLHPWRQVLQAVADRCREHGAAETERLLGRRRAVLAAYEPALATLPGPPVDASPSALAPEAARHRLFTFLLQTLAALAEERPVLVVLDDLQWADELTLGFCEFLAGSPQPTPLHLLGTYRLDEAGSRLRALAADDRVHDVRLSSLDFPAVGQMVGEMLAMAEPPEGLVGYVSRVSEGNPFFVAEYLRTALSEGLLRRDATGRWSLGTSEVSFEPLPLPRNVQALIGRRLDGLSEGGARLVTAAAILGRPVSHAVLATASEVDEGALLELLDEVVTRQVLEEVGGGRVQFLHDKIREVAGRRLSPEVRKELHRRAALAIETHERDARDSFLADLGHHYEEAGEIGSARDCYWRAARRARDGYATAEAERLYEAFLRLEPATSPDGIKARLELATVVSRTPGRAEQARAIRQECIDDAERIDDARLLADGLIGLGQEHLAAGELKAAEQCFERAQVEVQRVSEPVVQGVVVACQAGLAHRRGDLDRAERLYRHYVEATGDAGDRSGQARGLLNLAGVMFQLGQLSETRSLLERALATSREVGDRRVEGIALGNLGYLSDHLGDRDRARREYDEALSVHRAVDQPDSEARTLGNLAFLVRREGDIDGALDLYQRAMKLMIETGDRRSQARGHTQLAACFVVKGRLPEACSELEAAARLGRQTEDLVAEGEALFNRGDLERLMTGDLEAAERFVERGIELLGRAGDRNLLAQAWCSRGHLLLASDRSAADVIAQVETASREIGVGPGSQLLELLERLKAGERDRERGNPLASGESPAALPQAVRGWLTRNRPEALPGSR